MAPTTAKRSPSPAATSPNKKAKPSPASVSSFVPSLFEPATVKALHEQYVQSQPYRHAVVDRLFPDELLSTVRDELAVNDGGLVGFAHKSTDIYSLNQSFDLASLSTEHLPADTLARLPGLQELRASMYSPAFRAWVRDITGCGPLSQLKVDASSARYTQGCHLLLHDDVISTRRISWIMYLPTSPWSPEDGGALELYPALPAPLPTAASASGAEPAASPASWRDEVGSDVYPTKSIPPKWAQFVFFEVAPGESYHAVQEVVAGLPKERLSISGWFHKPMEGEDGYEGPEPEGLASSLAQITQVPLSSVLTKYIEDTPTLGTALSADDKAFLAPFLHPQYLEPAVIGAIGGQFANDSFLLLDQFLHPDLAPALEQGLGELDKKHGLDQPARNGRLPPMTAGDGDEGWAVVGPSTRQRFLSLSTASPTASTSSATATLRELLTTVLPSQAFRTWLALLTAFTPLAHRIEARRLRPGLDYTLARGEEGDASRLDVRLGLTPGTKWEDIDGGEAFGGWEAYLAPPDEDEDPAVYQASKPPPRREASEGADDDEDDEVEDDDGPLLTIQPSFNTLLVVLRDPKVMKFTKYVSASAPSSCWDVGGEWDIGVVDKDEDDEGDESEGGDDNDDGADGSASEGQNGHSHSHEDGVACSSTH